MVLNGSTTYQIISTNTGFNLLIVELKHLFSACVFCYFFMFLCHLDEWLHNDCFVVF